MDNVYLPCHILKFSLYAVVPCRIILKFVIKNNMGFVVVDIVLKLGIYEMQRQKEYIMHEFSDMIAFDQRGEGIHSLLKVVLKCILISNRGGKLLDTFDFYSIWELIFFEQVGLHSTIFVTSLFVVIKNYKQSEYTEIVKLLNKL